MSLRLFIYGAGAHARKAFHCAVTSGWSVAAFITDAPGARSPISRVDVLVAGGIEPPTPGDRLFVALGEARVRRSIMNRMEALGWLPATVVHPSAVVAPDAVLGDGVIVAAGAVVESATRIDRGAIVDIGVLVDHDCQVGEFVHLRPGDVLAPRSVVAGLRGELEPGQP